MVAAVKDLPQEVLEKIDYREWSLRTPEGVARFRELKAKSLPAVAIEGKLAFESMIPPGEDLVAAIESASSRKNNLTVVRVRAGACGFLSLIKAKQENKREVRIQIESDCESVEDLGFILEQLGPLGIKEIIATSQKANRVFEAASDKLPHAACPVPVAIIKASEVAMGLNVPSPITIEFASDSDDEPGS
jgi:hypothetical protein